VIDPRPVTDAVLTRLRTALAPLPVGDLTVPDGDPSVYVIVERPPGSGVDGTLGAPEATLEWRGRIRTVARSADIVSARKETEYRAAQARAALFDRTVDIAGGTWIVVSRVLLGSDGPWDDGPTVTVVDDIAFHVAPR